MSFRFLSLLLRLGTFAASVIVTGLTIKVFTERQWILSLLIYILSISVTSAFFASIIPYRNLIIDVLFSLAWFLAAAFFLIETFYESTCYGYSDTTSCSRYKVATAFCFIAAFAWLGSAGLGALKVLRPAFEQALKPDPSIGERTDTEKLDIEADRPERPSRNHFARHWIIYGFLTLVLVGAAIPVLYLIALPNIVIYLIDNSPLPPYSGAMFDPTNRSFTFNLSTTLRMPESINPRLSATNVSLFLPNSPPATNSFALVALPELKFKANQLFGITDQLVMITNTTEFSKLVKTAALSETLGIGIRAKAKAHVGPFHSTVDVNKVIEFKTKDRFSNIRLDALSLQRLDDDGYNVIAKGVLNNPSGIELNVGTIIADLFIGEIKVGFATGEANGIRAGASFFTAKGFIDLGLISSNLPTIIDDQLPYVQQNLLCASSIVTSVVHEGAELQYWLEALREVPLNITRPLKPFIHDFAANAAESLLGIVGIDLSSNLDVLVDRVVANLASTDADKAQQTKNALISVLKLGLAALTKLGYG